MSIDTYSRALDCLHLVSLSVAIHGSAISLDHPSHDTNIPLQCATTLSYHTYFAFPARTADPPIALTMMKCTPSVDEVYIRTQPTLAFTFLFPLFLFALLPRLHGWH